MAILVAHCNFRSFYLQSRTTSFLFPGNELTNAEEAILKAASSLSTKGASAASLFQEGPHSGFATEDGDGLSFN